MRVAVLGLGEAGSIYAADLAARGATVAGTDVRVRTAPPGVQRVSGVAAAVADAELVLSLVGAASAAEVLDGALPAMRSDAVYADMNTSGPDDKGRLAEVALAGGIAFADVAILAPVPRARIDTPLLLSGPAVAPLRALLQPLGMPLEDAGPEPGAAARLKLLRSVFMKGLAAVVVESVTAARIFGAEDWLVGQIVAELGASDRRPVDRLVDGTITHAVRREAEMIEVRELLDTLGAPHPMTDGTIASLHAIASRADAAPPVAER